MTFANIHFAAVCHKDLLISSLQIFVTHPLLKASDYCDSSPEAYLPNNISAGNWTDISSANWTDLSAANWTDVFAANWSGKLYPEFEIIERTRQPNTALLSLILMFSTFFLADFLRKFRNSSFLGRNVSILTTCGKATCAGKLELFTFLFLAGKKGSWRLWYSYCHYCNCYLGLFCSKHVFSSKNCHCAVIFTHCLHCIFTS